jgi:hypothetical protein
VRVSTPAACGVGRLTKRHAAAKKRLTGRKERLVDVTKWAAGLI